MTPESHEAPLRILYQDDACVVVDKPAGMILHRGASGAVLFALNEEAARTLNRSFADRSLEKRYLALTRGHPPEHGLIDHPIPRAPGEERVPAQTEYFRIA